MDLLVLLSGVADPKWPLPAPLSPQALRAHKAAYPLLSPFDEAALELALKLRDDHDGTRITALLATDSAKNPLLRTVASHRLDRVAAVDGGDRAFDALQWARGLAALLASAGLKPQLVLMGREFGDEDDGSCGPALAEVLQADCVTQALSVTVVSGVTRVARQAGSVQAVVTPALPAVVAVTNDARNRLRHPLMKNVAAARRMDFDLLPMAAAAPPVVELAAIHTSAPPKRGTSCRMLDGDVQQQAAALLAALDACGRT